MKDVDEFNHKLLLRQKLQAITYYKDARAAVKGAKSNLLWAKKALERLADDCKDGCTCPLHVYLEEKQTNDNV